MTHMNTTMPHNHYPTSTRPDDQNDPLYYGSTTTPGDYHKPINYRMPELFPSVTSMFDEADREIDAWRASNQDLQQEIEQLQQLVRSLTQSAKDIHHECTKPREKALKVDPSVKLRVGNTRAKASFWEQHAAVDGDEDTSDRGQGEGSGGGTRRPSTSMVTPSTTTHLSPTNKIS